MKKDSEPNMTFNGIPAHVEESLSGRERAPLAPDAWIRFQYISRMPGIRKNYRFLLMQDGRLYYAANTAEPAHDRSQVYNVDLPAQPGGTLPPEDMQEIAALLDETAFFDQPVYQEGPVRDGRLIILAVRQAEAVHEVWYSNVHNRLTDRLEEVAPHGLQQPTGATPADLMQILREQQDLADRLAGKTSTDTEND